MAKRHSAGILLYRRGEGGRLEVMLGHMGGPYWARKDAGAWSIPKGECEPGEDDLAAALREFEEEVGSPAPDGEQVALGDVIQGGGRKLVSIWAVEGDLDVSEIESSPFEMEWPPRSGRKESFPEFDRAEWFPLDVAREKIVKAQQPFLERVAELAAAPAGD